MRFFSIIKNCHRIPYPSSQMEKELIILPSITMESAMQRRISAVLNNDVTVITPGWIKELLGVCQRPEVGAAGVKLIYPMIRFSMRAV